MTLARTQFASTQFASGPYPLFVLGVATVALAFGVWGLHAWWGGRADRAALVERLAGDFDDDGPRRPAFAALDRRVRRYAWGRRLAGRLAATGTNLTPGQFTAAVTGVIAAAWIVAATLLAPFFGPIAALLAGWAASPSSPGAAGCAPNASSPNSPNSPGYWPTPPRPAWRCAPRSPWQRRSWRRPPARS